MAVASHSDQHLLTTSPQCRRKHLFRSPPYPRHPELGLSARRWCSAMIPPVQQASDRIVSGPKSLSASRALEGTRLHWQQRAEVKGKHCHKLARCHLQLLWHRAEQPFGQGHAALVSNVRTALAKRSSFLSIPAVCGLREREDALRELPSEAKDQLLRSQSRRCSRQRTVSSPCALPPSVRLGPSKLSLD